MTTVITVPIVCTQNASKQNNSNNVSSFSKIWINNNQNTEFVQKEFNSYLNYKQGKQNPNLSFLLMTGTSSKNAQSILKNTSMDLKKLKKTQQNQVKNQMLSMLIQTKTHKLNVNNAQQIFSKYTNSANAQKVQNQIDSIMSHVVSKKNWTKLISTDRSNLYSKNKFLNFNYFSNNEKTAAGKIINNLNITVDVFGTIATTAAIFLAAEWAVTWSFDLTVVTVIDAGIVAAVFGGYSGLFSIISTCLQAQAGQSSSGWGVAGKYGIFCADFRMSKS